MKIIAIAVLTLLLIIPIIYFLTRMREQQNMQADAISKAMVMRVIEQYKKDVKSGRISGGADNTILGYRAAEGISGGFNNIYIGKRPDSTKKEIRK